MLATVYFGTSAREGSHVYMVHSHGVHVGILERRHNGIFVQHGWLGGRATQRWKKISLWHKETLCWTKALLWQGWFY
jgi:hypothetical protein